MDPQTWNRYSYTLNNPLKYTDPLGLYVYAAGTTDDQKRQFEGALEKVRQARDNYRSGSTEYKRLDRALKAYGYVDSRHNGAGVDNGVTVRFAAAATPGNTDPGINANDKGQKVTTADNPTGQSTIVTIDPARNSGDNGYGFTIAHEGSHVADVANLVGALPTDLTSQQAQGIINGTIPFLGALNQNKWATEGRAYETEAFAAQALLSNQSLSVGGTRRYEIWNPTWAAADRATNRSRGIFSVLTQPRSQDGKYALNPFVGDMGSKLLH